MLADLIGEYIEFGIAECSESLAVFLSVGDGIEVGDKRKPDHAVVLTVGIGDQA